MMCGIAGQTAAYAAAAVTPDHAVVAGPDFAGMVKAPAARQSSPCHGLTPDCMAKMGCVPTSALPERMPPLARPRTWQRVRYPRRVTPVAGLTVEPEVFPPIA